LAKLYIAASIEVPVVNMLREILLIVALPIAIGVSINYFAPKLVKKIIPSLPLITMCMIIIVLSTVVSLSSDKIGIKR